MPKFRIQFFKKTVKGVVYRHPWLGYRQRNKNGTPTFVAVTSLNGLPEDVVLKMDAALRAQDGAPQGEVTFLDSECVGAPLAAWSIANDLGIWTSLEILDEPFRQIITVMVLDRVVADLPSSKVDLWDRLKTDKTVLAKLTSPEVLEATLHEFYTALEHLHEAQEQIEMQLFKRRDKVDRIYLYDITSSYFEGKCCTLSDYGYNRDGKKGKKQIVIGLLTDSLGMPISAKVFQGNTTDQSTVLDQIREIKTKLLAPEIVFVGDRGMLTSANRADLTEKEFADVCYISALPRAELEEIIEERSSPVENDLFTQKKMFEMHDEGRRVVFKHNPVRESDDSQTRDRLLAKTLEKLDKLKVQVASGKLKLRAAIAKRLHRWHNQWNMGKFIKPDYDTGKFDYTIDEEKLAKARRLDGWYAIVSNLADDDHTSAELVERYKSLKHVESAFRAIKTTDLFLRPIRHWNPERVKGHVFLCVLAYIIRYEARKRFEEFLAPVERSEDDDGKMEVVRQSLRRAWATLDTIKIGTLSIGGTVIRQLNPINQPAKKLLTAAGAKMDQPTKARLGIVV